MKKLITLLIGTLLFNCNWVNPLEPKLDKSNMEIITPVKRNDLIMNITLEKYLIGSKFNYSGKVQNSSGSNLILDNKNKKCLEYKLFNGTKEMSNKKIIADFIINLKSKGYLEIKQYEDTLKTSVCGADVEYQGKKYNIPFPLKISQTEINKGYVFTEEGKYHFEINISYALNDTTYNSIFMSEVFDVGINTSIKENKLLKTIRK